MSHEQTFVGQTGHIPQGVETNTNLAGGTVNYEFTTPVPINLLEVLVGVNFAGAGAGVGTGTLATTVLNYIRVYRGSKDKVTSQKPIIDIGQGAILAAVRRSAIAAHAFSNGAIPNALDPVLAANATPYGAHFDFACQLKAGTWTVQVNFLAVSAVSYPTFATPPLTVNYSVAAAAFYFNRPVAKNEGWVAGQQVATQGFSTTPVKDIYIESIGAVIPAVLNRAEFDVSINAFGMQTLNVQQQMVLNMMTSVINLTGADTCMYRSSQDAANHTFSISVSAVTTINYVVTVDVDT